MNNKVDLHVHTLASDGADSVQNLLNTIQNTEIHTFAITDHDTIEASKEMAKLVPDNLNFIKGVEFSCVTPHDKCHILGYNFNPEEEAFQKALQSVKDLRQEKKNLRIAYFKNELGIVFTKDEEAWLNSQISPGKPNFGMILVNRGIAPDINTAILQYINKCKTPRKGIDARIAVEGILKSDGIPVWAHPLGGENERRLTEEEFYTQLEELLSCGIQGLECYYSRYSQEEIDFLLKVADEYNLLISAGSDYHGANKTNLDLGQLNSKNEYIDESNVSLLHKLNIL